MSLIPLAAPLIRRAIADESYAQDLIDALDGDSLERLVFSEVQQSDLRWLSPTQWQWFGGWRQALGGRLDIVVLEHLARSATTRFERFELRTLVLRDPHTNQLLVEPDSPAMGHPDEIGINWLTGEAQSTTRPLEWTRDALQCASEASWFVLRQLVSLDDDRSVEVRAWLSDVALSSEIPFEMLRRWGMSG